MGFLKSKFSGYLAVALLLGLVAGGFYVYKQGITLGELQQAADTLSKMKAEQESRRDILSTQSAELIEGRQEIAIMRARAREAESKADESFINCMSMPVPDGMRIRPERQGAP